MEKAAGEYIWSEKKGLSENRSSRLGSNSYINTFPPKGKTRATAGSVKEKAGKCIQVNGQTKFPALMAGI